MSVTGETYAAQLDAALSQVADYVNQCSDSLWRAACADDGRPVGVVAHHIANGTGLVASFAEMMANGQPPPTLTPEILAHANAEHAQQHAQVTPAETLALLQENGAAAKTLLLSLSDEQIERARPMIERVLIGHPLYHLERMRQTDGN